MTCDPRKLPFARPLIAQRPVAKGGRGASRSRLAGASARQGVKDVRAAHRHREWRFVAVGARRMRQVSPNRTSPPCADENSW